MSIPLVKLLIKAMKAYEVPITHKTVEQTVLTHPEFPSMQSISDAFDSWKVKHVVLKLTLEKLRTLDVPVISSLNNSEYIWINKVTDKEVHYWGASDKEKVENCEKFEKSWTGVSLAIEDTDNAGEPNYKENCNREIKEKVIKFILPVGSVLLLTVLACFSWIKDSQLSLLSKLLLFFINTTGFYIGYILMRQEKSQSSRMIQKFCKAGTHIDCNKVIQSRYSKLFGMVSYAELGMAYFSAVILWLIIAPLSIEWLAPFQWFLLASLPFTIWSLFTQAFLIRKWCLFCCTIVLLLWLNVGIFYVSSTFVLLLPAVESALSALLFSGCIVGVVLAGKAGNTDFQYAEQREIARIKYNFQVLQSQLAETYYETGDAGFVWGNLHSSCEIALYVSISCSHCEKAIKEMLKINDVYPGFRFRLIFSIKSDNVEDKANIVTCHFLNMFKTMKRKDFFTMLIAWYTTLNRNVEALLKSYPVSNDQNYREEIDAMYQFSKQAKISYTPALLLKGRLLSQLYSYQDLYGIARTLYAEE